MMVAHDFSRSLAAFGVIGPPRCHVEFTEPALFARVGLLDMEAIMELTKFVAAFLPRQQRARIRALPAQLSNVRSLLQRAATEAPRTKRDSKQTGTRH